MVEVPRREAVGCHVFAGGFTAGVKRVFDVACQLELHGLGVETAERVWGVPVHLSDPREWPQERRGDFFYGNPRCTGFSCVTAGYSESGHGPWSKQCQDVHDFMEHGLSRQYPVLCWESVQQAYTVGKPLLDLWTERCVAAGYRVAHVFVTASAFGNCQTRKRYFYVAYPREKAFNVDAPAMPPGGYYPVVWDAIGHRADREVSGEYFWSGRDYDQDSVMLLTDDEKVSMPHLPTGWSLNHLAMYHREVLSDKYRRVWDTRNSDMPFSMHAMFRPSWFRPSPTLTSTSARLIHPWRNRPFTVGELADIMGWGGEIPVGDGPSMQIAKGIVPAIGEWLAVQVTRCLDDQWGGEDWWTKYDHHVGAFDGGDSSQADEKTIDLTHYYPRQFDMERYPDDVRSQYHRFNVDHSTGRLARPWREVSLASG